MKASWYRLIPALTLIILTGILIFACQKDVTRGENIPSGKVKLSIFLTDGPNDYQQVLIDIQSIDVKIDTCRRNHHEDDHNRPGCDDDRDSVRKTCEIWQSININPGIYDLLTLRNGTDTLLASGFLLEGKIERIKFTLGTNNSVMVDSVVYPLNLINNQNYVYVNISRLHLDSISSNNFNLYLDFNLDRSIKYVNGKYWLKPVIKPFGKHSSGEIEGKIRPNHSYRLVKAYNDVDTAFARPWESQGEFKIRGLKDGVYSVFIEGKNGYNDSTITNVSVQRGRETKLGTIQLHL